MVDIAVPPALASPSFVRRFIGNKAIFFSLSTLVLITLACLLGPLLSPHPYDRIYRDHVLAEPAFTSHPQRGELDAAIHQLARNMRVDLVSYRADDTSLTAIFASQKPIDLRVLRYFTRSDDFESAQIVASEEMGKRITVNAPLRHLVFLLGTDANGRDLLTRILISGRISLAVGLLASFVALVIGAGYGAIAGYAGGAVDLWMMRFVEIVYALPFIFFVILLSVIFGRSFLLVFIAIGSVEWLDMARIMRGQTLSLKQADYVKAAEALGSQPWAILWRHIIPNALAPIAAYLTLLIPRVILLESFVSFLGFGVQEPLSSWGVLIADGARQIQGAAYLLIFPATFLAVTLAALQNLGESWRGFYRAREG
jgi:oligopeptide transport system permease protein